MIIKIKVMGSGVPISSVRNELMPGVPYEENNSTYTNTNNEHTNTNINNTTHNKNNHIDNNNNDNDDDNNNNIINSTTLC